MRFGRAQKIKKRGEISRLFKEGQRWECGSFVLIYGLNGLRHDRLGVIVSKRLGSAVERNRAKRVFREVYRNGIKPIPPFFDILINPRAKPDTFWDVSEQNSFFERWQEEAKKSENQNAGLTRK